MQSENACNLELHSILGVLDQLEFDSSVSFVSRLDGKAFGAVILALQGSNSKYSILIGLTSEKWRLSSVRIRLI